MLNLKKNVKNTLDIIGVDVFFYYPKSFKKLPCISYYEANNSPYNSADDAEYLSKIVFIIDIWAKGSSEITEIAYKVNEQMNKIKFIREFSTDVYDSNSSILHKSMRFKIVC